MMTDVVNEHPLTRHELAEANNARDAVYPGAEYCSLAFRGLEMAGEVGEACNLVKKLIRSQHGIAGNNQQAEEYLGAVIDEMADAIITIDLLRLQLEKELLVEIDLSEAVRQKFNKTSQKIGVEVML